jgi:hypothetical protein
MLYAGTTKPLPPRKWQEEAPNVHVELLADREAPLKAHFTRPEVQCIGSTSGCGCDFPHAILQNGEWPTYFLECETDAEALANARFNRQRLVELLRESGEKTIELYGIWDGDFTESPKAQENINVQRILDSDFFFKEQGFYTVSIDS